LLCDDCFRVFFTCLPSRDLNQRDSHIEFLSAPLYHIEPFSVQLTGVSIQMGKVFLPPNNYTLFKVKANGVDNNPARSAVYY